MTKLLRILVGVRDDLDLQTKWWHRLLSVAFVLFVLVAVVTIGFLATDENPGANAGNSRVVTDIVTFTDTNRDSKNTIPAFFALEGRTGQLMSDGGLYQYYSTSTFDKSECRYVDPDKQTDPKNYIDVAPIDGFEIIGRTVPNAPGGELLDGYCMIQVGVEVPFGKNIVKWEYRSGMYAKFVGIALLFLALATLVVLNLYYRGLVYIVCGPRKKPAATV